MLLASQSDLDRTRTCNPRLRGPMPYPLGHEAFGWFFWRTACRAWHACPFVADCHPPIPTPHSGRLHACRVYRRGAIASPQHDVWAWPRACRWCCARAGSAAPSVTLYDRTTICCMRPQTFCVAAQADLGRTRTCNPRLRRPMPYPLGHEALSVAFEIGADDLMYRDA